LTCREYDKIVTPILYRNVSLKRRINHGDSVTDLRLLSGLHTLAANKRGAKGLIEVLKIENFNGSEDEKIYGDSTFDELFRQAVSGCFKLKALM
jgi:hypothetical protein